MSEKMDNLLELLVQNQLQQSKTIEELAKGQQRLESLLVNAQGQTISNEDYPLSPVEKLIANERRPNIVDGSGERRVPPEAIPQLGDQLMNSAGQMVDGLLDGDSSKLKKELVQHITVVGGGGGRII